MAYKKTMVVSDLIAHREILNILKSNTCKIDIDQ